MSMRELESSICSELRRIVKNRSIRIKNMVEWSAGQIKAQEGETLVYIPLYHVWVCIINSLDKRAK